MAPSKKQCIAAATLALLIYSVKRKNDQNIANSKKKRIRRFWVSEFLLNRDAYCIENKLLTDLLNADDKRYHNFLRLSHEEFLELHDQIQQQITGQDTIMRNAISTKVKLALTVRYLATGDSHRSLEFLSRVSRSTIALLIPRVCAAIYNVLQPKYMKVPSSQEEWLHIAKDYQELWHFPHTLGAMDGKHIAITAPINEGSMYFNYKGFHSIVLLAVVDAHYKFIYVDIGCNGRISDGGVYKNSSLYQALNIRNNLNIPVSSPLPGRHKSIPYFLIGDDAFALSSNIMKPYPRSGTISIKERVYNYRLCRARRVVENAFGIMSSRFRILRRTMEVSVINAEGIVKTCCVLHNYLRKKQSTYSQVDIQPNMENLVRLQHEGGNFSSAYAREIREELADYFLNEGELPFQWQNI